MPEHVVLLPSLGRPATDFDDLSGRLAVAGFSPLALEPTPSVPAGSTLVDLARDVLSRLDGLGVPDFHLVGHAFGNRLARAVTATSPSRIASLTLLACGGYVDMPDAVATALSNCFTLSPDDPAHLESVRLAFFAPGHDPTVWRRGWMPHVAAYQSATVRATDRSTWWDAVAPRVLIVQGLEDAVAPPENGRRYLNDHPDITTLVELERAGHALIVEQPDAVADAVVGIITSR